jgi:hypothetical protein
MFSLDEKNHLVHLLSRHQKKIITYKEDGEFVNEIALRGNPYPNQFVISNNLIYWDHIFIKNRNSRNLLSISDLNGKIISQLFPSEVYDKGLEQPLNFTNNFYKSTHDIKYSRPLFDTIYSLKGIISKPFIVIETSNVVTPNEIQYMNSIGDLNKFIQYVSFNNKFLGISNYLESSNYIYFRFKNKIITHDLFYNIFNNSVRCSGKLIDDLTWEEFPARFYSTYKDYFITCIQDRPPGRMDTFINNIKEKKIKLTKEDRQILEKITFESNPVIVFYEVNDKLN